MKNMKDMVKLFLKEETLCDPFQYKTKKFKIQRDEEGASCSREALIIYNSFSKGRKANVKEADLAN
jgi:hypothetical protein